VERGCFKCDQGEGADVQNLGGVQARIRPQSVLFGKKNDNAVYGIIQEKVWSKVMKCQGRDGLKDDPGDWPGDICSSYVKRNAVECVLCKKWVHTRCSGVKGKLKTNNKFEFSVCTGGGTNTAMEDKDLLLDNAGQLECVDRFYYFGDVTEDGAAVEEATMARVKCAWSKLMELVSIYHKRRIIEAKR
jgi:hypothetical protein